MLFRSKPGVFFAFAGDGLGERRECAGRWRSNGNRLSSVRSGEVILMIHMTAAEYKAYLSNEKIPKYRNKKIYVYKDGFVSESKCGGHGECEVFDSQKEYTRFKQLQLLKSSGAVSTLSRQVPFVILEAFTSGDGIRHKAIVYYADFTYEENGREIVEDVKGVDRKPGVRFAQRHSD